MAELEVSADCKNLCESEFCDLDEKYYNMDDIESDLYTIEDADASPELSLKIKKIVAEIYSSVNEYVNYYHSSKNLSDDLSHLSLNQQWIVTTKFKKLVTGIYSFINEYIDYYHSS